MRGFGSDAVLYEYISRSDARFILNVGCSYVKRTQLVYRSLLPVRLATVSLERASNALLVSSESRNDRTKQQRDCETS